MGYRLCVTIDQLAAVGSRYHSLISCHVGTLHAKNQHFTSKVCKSTGDTTICLPLKPQQQSTDECLSLIYSNSGFLPGFHGKEVLISLSTFSTPECTDCCLPRCNARMARANARLFAWCAGASATLIFWVNFLWCHTLRIQWTSAELYWKIVATIGFLFDSFFLYVFFCVFLWIAL